MQGALSQASRMRNLTRFLEIKGGFSPRIWDGYPYTSRAHSRYRVGGQLPIGGCAITNTVMKDLDEFRAESNHSK